MIRVQFDFNARVAEIEAYLGLVQQIDAGKTLLTQYDNYVPTNTIEMACDHLVPAYSHQEQSDIIRTCKASAMLLLYNLMESTVSNAIEAIFDEFSNKGVAFDSCRQTIRRVVLSNLRELNPNEVISLLNCLSVDVVTKTFRKKFIVSGNVDARKIKEVADEYGFEHPAADGRQLLTVKTSRNDLAHGSKSFAEVGRDFTVAQIISMKDEIIAYLALMLTNVAAYINGQHYLAAPGRP